MTSFWPISPTALTVDQVELMRWMVADLHASTENGIDQPGAAANDAVLADPARALDLNVGVNHRVPTDPRPRVDPGTGRIENRHARRLQCLRLAGVEAADGDGALSAEEFETAQARFLGRGGFGGGHQGRGNN